jgi:hypothetical protein
LLEHNLWRRILDQFHQHYLPIYDVRLPSKYFLDLVFSNDPTQTSVEFSMAIKYESAGVADCIQIGRIGYLGGQPERCNNVFDWPAEFTTNAKSGQTFSTSIDVSSANYQWPAGPYTVSIFFSFILSAIRFALLMPVSIQLHSTPIKEVSNSPISNQLDLPRILL